MRVVHLADLHLGIRQHTKLTPGGLNQREADVAQTFARVMRQVAALQPDLVVIAGDCFHVVRPSNHAINAAFLTLHAFRVACPAPVVIISGNHETPKGPDTGCILPLFASIDGVTVIDGPAARVRIGDVSVCGVPEKVAHLTRLQPDPRAELNLLLLHGDVAGTIPGTKPGSTAIDPAQLSGTGWDYVALGHYHVTTEVAPRVWYAGAIDYTSSNPWGELKAEASKGYAGKGFLEADLATGQVTRHAIPGTRRWLDLPAIDADGWSAAQIDDAIAAHVAAVDLTDAVVRQVVRNVPRDREVELQSPRRREWIRATLDWRVDVRRPEVLRTAMGSPVAAIRRKSLPELFADQLEKLPAEERAALVALSSKYLARAEEAIAHVA